ncbi:MAG: YeeE/YedE family protein [Paraburkholderia sp.]|nr:YeeE/YedE family protein [Paraburkholderia sp.]
MSLDLAHFTPLASFAGGLMIGAATALFVLGNGRVAGISGIVGGLLQGGRAAHGQRAWRLAFIAGLAAAPWLWRLVATSASGIAAVGSGALSPTIDASSATLVAAGLLVGVGTRYASGCTSGHGVCGISRGSLRSFIATGLFMAAGFVTVFAVRHLVGV